MYALVVCDEVGGATEPLARRIATGLRAEHFAVVQLASMADATDAQIGDADLIVIGSPGPGALGRWNERLRDASAALALFAIAPARSAGRAATWLATAASDLHALGFDVVTAPVCFAVGADGRPEHGELRRAAVWSRTLAARASSVDSYDRPARAWRAGSAA